MEKQYLEAITENKDGELIAIASTEDKDRVGDVLKVMDWNFANFKKNPVLQAGHDYRPQFTIGVAKNLRVENNRVVFTPSFHDITQLARDISKMYKQGFLKAWSVGFIPARDKGQKHELLEVSAVAVPANPEALTMVAKSLDIAMEDAKKLGETSVAAVEEWIQKEAEQKDGDLEANVDEKPFPQQHACRLRNPDDFQSGSFRSMTRAHQGKNYRVIMGKLNGEDTMTEQSYRYNKDTWDIPDARSHCKSHGGIGFEAAATQQGAQKDNMTDPVTGQPAEPQDMQIEDVIKSHFDDMQMEVEESMTSHMNQCLSDLGMSGTSTSEGQATTESAQTIKKVMKKDGSNQTRDIPQKIERWNKSLSKAFDIEGSPSTPATYEYEIYSKFLECRVKNIFQNSFVIPSPLLGTYLSSIKAVMENYKLEDTRNYAWGGTEMPPIYEVIQLTIDKSDDFLIEGINFYRKEDKDIVIKFQPTWFGMIVDIVTGKEDKELNRNILKDIHSWIKENNYLKGQKFSLSGEFLNKTEDSWKDVILETDTKDAVQKAVKQLNDKKGEANSRGLMFVGLPGTGKTQTGRVMFNETEATFVWVTSKDIAYSPTENLSLAFKLAQDLAPSILFLEDIDAWLKGYQIDLLKTEMDGLKRNKGMITVLTSNNPEKLPDALLDRPGRFHDVLDFKLPDIGIRKQMLEYWAGESSDEIIAGTEGFSGAHIKELVDFAKLIREDEPEMTMAQALEKSLQKLKKQRELVTNIRNKPVAPEKQEPTEEKTQEKSVDTPQQQKVDGDKGRQTKQTRKSLKDVTPDEIALHALVQSVKLSTHALSIINKAKGK